jgi:Na+(H+)/acetate symporter ActP
MARKIRRRARRRQRRRGYRRNPGTARGLMAQVRQALPDVGWGVVGFVGTAALPNVAARFVPIPDKATNPLGNAVVKAAAALGTGFLVGMFAGRKAGQATMIGGGIAVAADFVLPFIAPVLGLSAYLDEESGVQAYLDNDGAIGYLNPGMEMNGGGGGEEGLPERLNPAMRF